MVQIGLNEAIGYTFNVNSDSFGDLLGTWKPRDVRFDLIYGIKSNLLNNNILELW